MKLLSLIACLLATIYCIQPKNPIPELPVKTYNAAKAEVISKKESLAKKYNSANPDEKKVILKEAGEYLDSAICELLFPYWKGTKWDFNGHTDIPNQGEIACGYLVSTLLKHAGIKLNRYKMAQQSALNEIKTISGKSGAKFLGDNAKDALEILSSSEDGLYILGLSNHVGFIRIKDNNVQFILSTYLEPTQAINEQAKLSDAFIYSNVYYIGQISGSSSLMRKWLTEEVIQIVYD